MNYSLILIVLMGFDVAERGEDLMIYIFRSLLKNSSKKTIVDRNNLFYSAIF